MRAACAVLALALLTLPCAAQVKQTNGTTTPGAADESTLVIPGGDTAGNAAGATAATGNAGAATGVTTWDFVRMVVILAAIVGVIYLVFWLLKRGAGKRVQENDLIHLLGSKSLASNRSLHLVEVGASIYLIGSSDGGVQLIAEVTDKETLDSVRLKAAEESPNGRRSFSQVLAEIFKPAKRPLSVNDGIGLLKGQREKLKKL